MLVKPAVEDMLWDIHAMETVVARVSVGRWGRNLAIRLPRKSYVPPG